MRLCVISVDAMVYEDIPLLLSMKNSSVLFAHAARVEKMETVYPSLTHPVHAALITGCSCGKNGVAHNTHFDPYDENQIWYNQLSDIQCETIFHAAKRAGLTSCAARWPLTAKGNDVIDCIVPEILDVDLKNGKTMNEVLLEGGSGPIFDDIVSPNLNCLDGNSRPGYDAFSAACSAEAVRRRKPDLVFTHWGMVDSARHRDGMFGPHIREALLYIDEWVGWLMKAYSDAGILDETNFVVLSDHGQLDVNQKICLNSLFVKEGLIEINSNGTLKSWKAYVNSAGLSAQVYLKDPDDQITYNHVKDLLSTLSKDKTNGIDECFTTAEVKERFGLDGTFSFVVDTDGQTSFGNDLIGPVVRTRAVEHIGSAGHGHLPTKGCQPTMLAAGPAFQPDAVIKQTKIINIAPTLAAVVGFKLESAEGEPLFEVLRT